MFLNPFSFSVPQKHGRSILLKLNFFKFLESIFQTMEPYIGQLMAVSFDFAPRGWAMCNGQLLPINQHQALFSLLGTTYGGNGTTNFGLPDLRGRTLVGVGHGQGLPNIQQGEMAGSPTVTLTSAQMPAHNHAVDMSKTEVNINATVTGTIKTGATASGNFPATSAPVTGDVAIPVNTTGGFGINSKNPGQSVLTTTAANTYSTAPTANEKYSGSAIPLTNGKTSIPQTALSLPVSGSVDVPISTKAPVVGNATTAVAGSNQPVGIMSPYLGMNYCIALQGIYPSRD
jgi:microcystin-dependent protein